MADMTSPLNLQADPTVPHIRVKEFGPTSVKAYLVFVPVEMTGDEEFQQVLTGLIGNDNPMLWSVEPYRQASSMYSDVWIVERAYPLFSVA